MELYQNLKINGWAPKDLAPNFDFSIQADQIKVNFRSFFKKGGIFIEYLNGLSIL